MTRIPVFSFLIGWYFATLQFGYLLLLQVNYSATYVSYMIVVISWLAGAVGGLWIAQPRLGAGLVGGTLVYYGVYYLTRVLTGETLILAVTVLGAVAGGGIAGRFFRIFSESYGQVDRLFFHENNGFILGVLMFFLGFTLLGRAYLLWSPALLMAPLLGYLVGGVLPGSRQKENETGEFGGFAFPLGEKVLSEGNQ